jgi:hypothetical protein
MPNSKSSSAMLLGFTLAFAAGELIGQFDAVSLPCPFELPCTFRSPPALPWLPDAPESPGGVLSARTNAWGAERSITETGSFTAFSLVARD